MGSSCSKKSSAVTPPRKQEVLPTNLRLSAPPRNGPQSPGLAAICWETVELRVRKKAQRVGRNGALQRPIKNLISNFSLAVPYA